MAFLGLFLDDFKLGAISSEVSEWHLTQPGQQEFLTLVIIEKGCALSVPHDKVMDVLATCDTCTCSAGASVRRWLVLSRRKNVSSSLFVRGKPATW